MDGVHDMGGMHGFGRVDVSDDAAFHENWERRVLGVRMATILAGHGRGELRAYIESIPAVRYLASRYYQRWALALEAAVVDTGLLTEAEIGERAGSIADGRVGPPRATASALDEHAEVAAILKRFVATAADVPARFGVGDRVRVRRMAPAGHTRCPRYVRGVEGTVERVTGGFRRPDPGGHPLEQTYTVRFSMRDLWGAETDGDVLHLDLWEGYLE